MYVSSLATLFWTVGVECVCVCMSPHWLASHEGGREGGREGEGEGGEGEGEGGEGEGEGEGEREGERESLVCEAIQELCDDFNIAHLDVRLASICLTDTAGLG